MNYKFIFSIKILICVTLQLSAQNFIISQQEEYRNKIRSTLFVPDQLPALNSKSYGSFEPCDGVIAERISYSTSYGLEVPAILYLPSPRPTGKIPALVIVNGHGGDKYSWNSYYAGMIYAKGGAAVLTYDQIGEGERNINRNSGTRAHDVFEEPSELALRLSGLMMADVMQAVSYLSERKEVDKSKIAALGHSMGSFVLSITGAVDTRIHSVVLSGGGNLDDIDGYWDNSKQMCQGIPYKALRFLGDRAKVIYSLQVLRGPLYVYNGLQDSVVSIPELGTWSFFDDLYDRAYDLIGDSVKLFDYNFEEGGHRPYFLTKSVGIWLEKQIDFPNWTEEEIKAMDVTHIGEWAKKDNIIDGYYASELHAGGTRALGVGIPVLDRDSLHAIPFNIWEEFKEGFVYEGWLKNAKLRQR
ncbi:alpha/beta hydrolase family protein [Membranihabitans marinus]|uniref:alpha/beta hydrolase family protein n=1 Tax=Membranihabitans marinus TaxID=1227546 RepID=UPI001F3ADBD3|nr:alpha/beta fold hydrolase [Membranihabitans marinus]